MMLKTARKRKCFRDESKVKWKREKMESPGFYYGIFIKYLYKLYKEDVHLFKYIQPPLPPPSNMDLMQDRRQISTLRGF